MVRYNLANGKTVLLTVNQFLDLTDEDIQNLMASNKGMYIEDPFEDKYIPPDYEEIRGIKLEDIKELEIEELPEEEIKKIKKQAEDER